MTPRAILQLLAILGLLVGAVGVRAPAARAQEPSEPKTVDQADRLLTTDPTSYTDQIILKYRSSAGIEMAQAAEANRMQALNAAAGVEVSYFREMSGDAHVLRLPQALPESEVAEIARKLAALPEVEYAEPDARMFPLAVPNDPRYSDQWHYSAPITGSYGANLPAAWDLTTGSASVRVAVLDSGILLNHPDLLGRTVPGYDFVSDPIVANDGDGRDGNAADPGDWVSNSDKTNNPGTFGACPVLDSSWHGTHVAGTIGAATNNGSGVAGINWVSPILPVRVLGKCFGYTSDIADGIRWAAGVAVASVPANTTPARVINMSLGGGGSCDITYQSAIDAAVAAGSVVVVAAGNSNLNASNFRPANCSGVITVAATNRDGNKATYSNFGATVEIAAPGGQTSTPANGVLSTLNSGLTVPDTHSYQFYQGTSMAAPHVAGIASLMLSVNPSLTPAQVLSLIQSTPTAFPAGSTCTTSLCGSGIINAAAAVQAAQNAPSQNQRVFLPLITRDSGGGGGGGGGLVPNGDFEQGATIWSQVSANGRQQIRNSFAPNTLTPYSGAWGVWLGGSFNELGYIQQTVTVPAGAPYLYFYNWIGSADIPGYDFGYIIVNSATIATVDLHAGANTGGWVKRVTNLGAYAGQTVTLQIAVTTDDANNSNWFIDDVGFQSTP